MITDRRFLEDVKVGEALGPLTRRPTEVALFRFSAVTWNAHRIHYDLPYAKSEGYPGVLVQGMLHGAYFVQLVTHWMGKHSVLEEIGWQNRRPAFAGDELVLKGTVVAVDVQSRRITIDLEEFVRDELVVRGRAVVRMADGTASASEGSRS